jgi:hypothetical protein
MSWVVWSLTHPQVAINPTNPVPKWSLISVGQTCAEELAKRDGLSDTT